MNGIHTGLFFQVVQKKNTVAAQNVLAEVTSRKCKKLLAFKTQMDMLKMILY